MVPKRRVIITGGGTGGHVYPALAIIEAISGVAEIEYVGHPDRLEGKVVPEKGIPFHPLHSLPATGGIRGRLRLACSLTTGILQGLRLIRKLKPDLIIGVGGYVSVPMVLAGLFARRAIVLHEQNVAPGMANRFLARFVGMPIMTTFPVAKRYFSKNEVIVTGCPVRKTFGRIDKAEARKALGVDLEATIVLVVGGSLGAPALNRSALALLPLLALQERLWILHATGRRYFQDHRATLDASGTPVPERYKTYEYLDESALFMAAADVIVSRSGASTLSEIFCAGLPSVLLPSPNVAENHQAANATFAKSVGAAVVVIEEGDYPAAIRKAVADIIADPGRLMSMRAAAKAHCRGITASEEITRQVLRLTNRPSG